MAASKPLLVDDSGTILPDPFLVISFIEGSTHIGPTKRYAYIETMAQALANIHEQSLQNLPKLPTRTDPLPELLDYLPTGAQWSSLRSFLETFQR